MEKISLADDLKNAPGETKHAINANALDLLSEMPSSHIGRHTTSQRNLDEHTTKPESATEMASRLIASTAAGCVSRYALHLMGLQHVPKIGVPCAIVAPFLLAGAVSSYEKTQTLTDPRSFGEGAFIYGGLSGMQHLGRTVDSHMAGVIQRESMTTRIPMPNHVNQVLRNPGRFIQQ